MSGWNFPLIVVLFILLIIVGCSCFNGHKGYGAGPYGTGVGGYGPYGGCGGRGYW